MNNNEFKQYLLYLMNDIPAKKFNISCLCKLTKMYPDFNYVRQNYINKYHKKTQFFCDDIIVNINTNNDIYFTSYIDIFNFNIMVFSIQISDITKIQNRIIIVEYLYQLIYNFFDDLNDITKSNIKLSIDDVINITISTIIWYCDIYVPQKIPNFDVKLPELGYINSLIFKSQDDKYTIIAYKYDNKIEFKFNENGKYEEIKKIIIDNFMNNSDNIVFYDVVNVDSENELNVIYL